MRLATRERNGDMGHKEGGYDRFVECNKDLSFRSRCKKKQKKTKNPKTGSFLKDRFWKKRFKIADITERL